MLGRCSGLGFVERGPSETGAGSGGGAPNHSRHCCLRAAVVALGARGEQNDSHHEPVVDVATVTGDSRGEPGVALGWGHMRVALRGRIPGEVF